MTKEMLGCLTESGKSTSLMLFLFGQGTLPLGQNMGFVKSYLKRKGWSKTRLEWFSIAVNIGFYVLLIGLFVYIGAFDQMCRLKLPTGEVVEVPLWENLSVNQSVYPNLTDFLVETNMSYCWYENVMERRLVCNFSGLPVPKTEPFTGQPEGS